MLEQASPPTARVFGSSSSSSVSLVFVSSALHDAASSVATVVSTESEPPRRWSGPFFNFVAAFGWRERGPRQQIDAASVDTS
jgi:hypothetical protein